MNQWVGQGGVTKDLEFHDTGYGSMAVTFTIAVDKVYYDKETRGSKVATLWVSCNAVGPVADRLQAEVVGKGSKVRIVGELDQSPPKEGEQRGHTRINVLDFSALRYATAPTRFPTSPGPTGQQSASQSPKTDPWAPPTDSTDEPPF